MTELRHSLSSSTSASSFEEFRTFCSQAESYITSLEHVMTVTSSSSSTSRTPIFLNKQVVTLRSAAAVVRCVSSSTSWEDLAERATPSVLEAVLPLAEIEAFLYVLQMLQTQFEKWVQNHTIQSRPRLEQYKKRREKYAGDVEDDNECGVEDAASTTTTTTVDIDLSEFVSRIASLAIATAWDRVGLPPPHVVLTGVQSLMEGNSVETALRHTAEAMEHGMCREVPLSEEAIDFTMNVGLEPLRECVLGEFHQNLKVPRGLVYVIGAMYYSTTVTEEQMQQHQHHHSQPTPQPTRTDTAKTRPTPKHTWPFVVQRNEDESSSSTTKTSISIPDAQQVGIAVKNVRNAVTNLWNWL